MKSRLSRVLALSLLVSASLPTWAQPPAAVPPQPDAAPQPAVAPEAPKAPILNYALSNLEGLALLGAFYNKMLHAESYRGRMTTSRSSMANGRVLFSTSSEIQSSWMRDVAKDGVVNKLVFKTVYTKFENGKTTVDRLYILVDGAKKYRSYENRNEWNEGVLKLDETPIPLYLVSFGWVIALQDFGTGKEFKLEHKLVNGQEMTFVNVIAGEQDKREFIFDAKSGNLLSISINNGFLLENYHWFDSEFDVPLDDSLFKWKAPEGSTQVAPGAFQLNLEL